MREGRKEKGKKEGRIRGERDGGRGNIWFNRSQEH